MQAFNTLIANKVLRFRPNSIGREYSLQRPLTIMFPVGIMNKLKSIYNASIERGGLFELSASNGKLTCIEFHQVNGSNNSTSYNPNAALWNEKVQQILGRGNLPLAVHTHPTKIGLHAYDSKQVRFYLKSSRPDRLIADKTISENLQMPEAIFVKDERFGTGYGLALYEGGVFPYAISAISDTQLVILIGTGLLMAFNKLSRKVLYLLIGWFLFEFLRRPKYEYDSGGNLEIRASY
jgi:hypothetical protein